MTAPNPGPEMPPRLSVSEFLGDVADELFNADRGLPYTVATLSLRPQQLLRGWLEWRDARCTRPFRYFLIAGGLAVLVFAGDARLGAPDFLAMLRLFGEANDARSFGYAAGFVSGRFWGESPQWTLLLLTPFLALWLHLLHGRARLNFAESWACSLYAVGHAVLVGSIATVIVRLGLPVPIVPMVVAITGVIWVWIAAGAVRADLGERLIPALLSAPLAVVSLLAVIVGVGTLFGALL